MTYRGEYEKEKEIEFCCEFHCLSPESVSSLLSLLSLSYLASCLECFLQLDQVLPLQPPLFLMANDDDHVALQTTSLSLSLVGGSGPKSLYRNQSKFPPFLVSTPKALNLKCINSSKTKQRHRVFE
jgi:hypothetical protein